MTEEVKKMLLPTPNDFRDADECRATSPWEWVDDYGELAGDSLTRVIENKESGELWQCEIYFGGSWEQAGDWKEGKVSRCVPRQVEVTQYFEITTPVEFSDLLGDDLEEEEDDEW